MTIAEIFFWICVAALFHSYIFYPLVMQIFSSGKKQNQNIYQFPENLPAVSILIAVYNEENVIAEKIESIFKTTFPVENLEVIIGSDNSTDRTDEIVKNYCRKYPQLYLEEFTTRTGKAGIVNEIYKKAKNEILILTDANVFFGETTIYELVKHFKNPKIALVDSNMINKGLKKEGISIQEKTYIQTEVAIKNAESKLWGAMMGPFGGCYALRREYFSEVPANFLVDDFYINMKALEKGGQCINEINAKVFEDVSNNLKDEFHRKVRIATGNFQNLFSFFHLLLRFNGISFCFFSHKVLRWFGPFFMIAVYFSNLFLLQIEFYKWVFILQNIFYLIPLIDFFFKKIDIHLAPLRYATHLLAMNLALLMGFINFLKGVKSSVWQPTKRNQ